MTAYIELEVDGIFVKYPKTINDSRQKVLFVHGAAGSLRQWDIIANYLNDSVQSTLIDLPGHGRSQDVVSENLDVMCSKLFKALSIIGHTKFDVIVAHSLGGIIITKLLSQYTIQTSKIIFLASAPTLHLHPDFLSQLKNGRIEREFIKSGLNTTMDDDLIDLVFEDHLQVKIANNKLCLFDAMQFDMKDDLNKLSQAIYFIHGAKDKVVSPRRVRTLAKSLPNCKVEIIDDCRHYPHLEQPYLTASYIKNYIEVNDHGH